MFNTDAIHKGYSLDPVTGSLAFPIYQTSSFSQEIPGNPRIYQNHALSYARSENPTRTAVENALASLENAKYGISFASGLAAISALIQNLNSGDHVVSVNDMYGGAYRQFTKVFARLGIEFTFIDATELSNIEPAIKSNTRYLWLESPSNPLLNVTDISEASKIAHAHNLNVVVDNTFATPYLQNPLSLGADIVIHSATKYLGGHSDAVHGVVITNDPQIEDDIRFIQNAVGAVPGPQDCFLVMRGIKSLGIRMDRHCENARKIAEWLEGIDTVDRVFYPGLKSHKGYTIASKQMKQPGAIVSFELKGGEEKSREFVTHLKYFVLAESLGGVKSLINIPALMTHASMEPEARAEAGIKDGLIRASVGIEDIDDLINDLKHAFDLTYK